MKRLKMIQNINEYGKLYVLFLFKYLFAISITKPLLCKYDKVLVTLQFYIEFKNNKDYTIIEWV